MYEPRAECHYSGHEIKKGVCIHCGDNDYETDNLVVPREESKELLIEASRKRISDIETKAMKDYNAVNPKHYTSMAISPHEYNVANKMEWNEAQVIKYISRWRNKNGIEDLRKAEWYLQDLIRRESNEGTKQD